MTVTCDVLLTVRGWKCQVWNLRARATPSKAQASGSLVVSVPVGEIGN